MSKKLERKVVIRYSESFKRAVVSKWESGDYESLSHLKRANGIRGCGTVENWIAKYGDMSSLPKKVRIETMSEQDELSKARKQIRELESALSELSMRSLVNECFLQEACDWLNTDVESFKKKHAVALSQKSKKRVKKGGCR